MELLVYDTNINLLGIIDTPNAVIWHRRFFQAGDFEIHCPANEIELNLLQRQRYITKSDSVEFGFIESVMIEQNESGETIKAVGRFGASLLARRIVLTPITFNSTVESAMRSLVYDNAIDTSGELLFSEELLFSDDLLFTASRRIPKLELGNLNGFTESVSFQVSYKNLVQKLSELSLTSGIAFRLRLDPSAKKLTFETYKSLDRSMNQTSNPRVIFSQDYDNLAESVYFTSDANHTNVVLVAGEGEGELRKKVMVGGGSDIDRKEIFVDAKNIRLEEGMSEQAYLELLKQTGFESLVPKVEFFEGSVLPNGNATYKNDYDLGDIVTIENTQWNKRITVRINEITEVYDQNGLTIVPVFGEPQLTLSEQLSR